MKKTYLLLMMLVGLMNTAYAQDDKLYRKVEQAVEAAIPKNNAQQQTQQQQEQRQQQNSAARIDQTNRQEIRLGETKAEQFITNQAVSSSSQEEGFVANRGKVGYANFGRQSSGTTNNTQRVGRVGNMSGGNNSSGSNAAELEYMRKLAGPGLIADPNATSTMPGTFQGGQVRSIEPQTQKPEEYNFTGNASRANVETNVYGGGARSNGGSKEEKITILGAAREVGLFMDVKKSPPGVLLPRNANPNTERPIKGTDARSGEVIWVNPHKGNPYEKK